MVQEPPPQHERADAGRRPAWLLPTILGAAVVVVAAIVVVVLTTRGDSGPSASPSASVTTVVAPPPTPNVEPVARETQTPFTSALPATLLQYALASSAADTDWQGAGAVEAWSDTYTDGGSGTLTVQAGQWATPDEATAFAARVVAGLPAAPPASPSSSISATPSATGDEAGPTLPQTGDVLVGGTPAGTYTIVDAGDGTGVAVWTNGASVFRLVAPLADVVDAWASYPL